MNTEVAKEIVWTSLQMCETDQARKNTMNHFIELLGIEFVSQVVYENDTLKRKEETA